MFFRTKALVLSWASVEMRFSLTYKGQFVNRKEAVVV